jgi:hypothetical protein
MATAAKKTEVQMLNEHSITTSPKKIDFEGEGHYLRSIRTGEIIPWNDCLALLGGTHYETYDGEEPQEFKEYRAKVERSRKQQAILDKMEYAKTNALIQDAQEFVDAVDVKPMEV